MEARLRTRNELMAVVTGACQRPSAIVAVHYPEDRGGRVERPAATREGASGSCVQRYPCIARAFEEQQVDLEMITWDQVVDALG
jgi:hypothetical protein